MLCETIFNVSLTCAFETADTLALARADSTAAFTAESPKNGFYKKL